MLLNLLGHIVLHPYIDRESLSFLTLDTRPRGAVGTIHDGLVYEHSSSQRQALVENPHQQISNGVIRTAVPLFRARKCQYICAHIWEPPTKAAAKRSRIVNVRCNDDIVIVDDGDQQIALDLGVEMDFAPEARTIWDHLTE